jgi:hypothetical protein
MPQTARAASSLKLLLVTLSALVAVIGGTSAATYFAIHGESERDSDRQRVYFVRTPRLDELLGDGGARFVPPAMNDMIRTTSHRWQVYGRLGLGPWTPASQELRDGKPAFRLSFKPVAESLQYTFVQVAPHFGSPSSDEGGPASLGGAGVVSYQLGLLCRNQMSGDGVLGLRYPVIRAWIWMLMEQPDGKQNARVVELDPKQGVGTEFPRWDAYSSEYSSWGHALLTAPCDCDWSPIASELAKHGLALK